MALPSPQRSLLLVGPGKHFGAQLARRFAQEGFAVGLLARTRQHLDALVTELRGLGGVAYAATADVTRTAELQSAVSELAAALPPLSCVIYNVKASVPGTALELVPDSLTACLAANVSGALGVIQAVQPWLKDRRRTVILTGGGYKDRPNSSKLALSVSKAALHSLFRSATEPLAAAGVSLKTLVIDGVVREKGPLFPEDVAACFWAMYAHPTRRSYRYPPRPRAEDVAQLGLFRGLIDGAPIGN
jgi:NAD(P)-dependent dehydrogenase (short-subunit alcohol dehydrogenase family)